MHLVRSMICNDVCPGPDAPERRTVGQESRTSPGGPNVLCPLLSTPPQAQVSNRAGKPPPRKRARAPGRKAFIARPTVGDRNRGWLSDKPRGWREVVENQQQLLWAGNQISPARRSITARRSYTGSVMRRRPGVCDFSTRPFLCPTATAESATRSRWIGRTSRLGTKRVPRHALARLLSRGFDCAGRREGNVPEMCAVSLSLSSWVLRTSTSALVTRSLSASAGAGERLAAKAIADSPSQHGTVCSPRRSRALVRDPAGVILRPTSAGSGGRRCAPSSRQLHRAPARSKRERRGLRRADPDGVPAQPPFVARLDAGGVSRSRSARRTRPKGRAGRRSRRKRQSKRPCERAP